MRLNPEIPNAPLPELPSNSFVSALALGAFCWIALFLVISEYLASREWIWRLGLWWKFGGRRAFRKRYSLTHKVDWQYWGRSRKVVKCSCREESCEGYRVEMRSDPQWF
jgi:hypothetical protein